MMPIGTIIAWVNNIGPGSNPQTIPKCWIICDGRTIPEPSPWAGKKTKDLNGQGRFLRGGTSNQVLDIEEDTFQDHGHTVIDNGHSHSDRGHNHRHKYGVKHSLKPGGSGSHWANGGVTSEYTETGYASITTDKANIQIRKSDHSKRGQETRPKNMRIEWIMRIC